MFQAIVNLGKGGDNLNLLSTAIFDENSEPVKGASSLTDSDDFFGGIATTSNDEAAAASLDIYESVVFAGSGHDQIDFYNGWESDVFLDGGNDILSLTAGRNLFVHGGPGSDIVTFEDDEVSYEGTQNGYFLFDTTEGSVFIGLDVERVIIGDENVNLFEGFGGRRGRRRRSSDFRGSDLRYDLSITLEEAFSGKKQDIKFSTTEKCGTCIGSGSKPGHNAGACNMCGGHGQVRSSQGFFTVQQTCPQCSGSGEMITHPCGSCGGQGKKQASKRLSVTIPKGVDDGTRIRLSGKGEAGSRGGSNGDLYLFINVHSHELFKRSDENLFFECPISIADAALGTSIEIPTIDGGKAKIKIPAGTQSGKQFRLRAKGMPYMRGGDYGDLYVQVNTEVPVSLNKEQKELLEKFREIENEKSNPSIKKFFQKAKSFWQN